MSARLFVSVSFALLIGALGGCEELGNPQSASTAGHAQLVRETRTPHGVLVTEVRYVSPEQAPALVRAIRNEADHMDSSVPPGGSLVVVMVRPKERGPLPPLLHLATDFAYANGIAERRVWVARTSHARFVALFGLRGVPIEVRTTAL